MATKASVKMPSLEPAPAPISKKKTTESTVQTVRLDRRTHKALKDLSFENGQTQQEVLLEALQKHLKLI